MAAILLGAALIRTRLLEAPMERDEGENAYMAQLLLKGYPPYTLAYQYKLPGVYFAYALIMGLFGQTLVGIHLGLLLINAGTTLLLWRLGRRLFDEEIGLLAAASFALLSLSRSVQGIFAQAEHFVVLPALAGLLLLLRGMESGKASAIALSGLLLGLGFLMKQPGFLFVLLGIALPLITYADSPGKRRLRQAALVAATASLPLLGTCVALWLTGAFEKFWFWTFTYAKEYVVSLPLAVGARQLQSNGGRIVAAAPLLWGLAGVGLVSLAWPCAWRSARTMWLVVIASFLATTPGYFFRPHYFVLLLPAAALLVGLGVRALQRLAGRQAALRRRLPPNAARAIGVGIMLLALLQGVVNERRYLFAVTPQEATRATYGLNPFPESLVIADYIKARTTKEDRIAVLGSEPQIYFYADRLSATGYIHLYALMQDYPFARRMQEEMIREIEAAAPRYIVFVKVWTSWLVRERSPKRIFAWLVRYLREHYVKVGVVVPAAPRSIYRWDQDVDPQPPTPHLRFDGIEVYRRRDGA
ncbi:MAG: glycosyltransferase family 39 protein [Candidatus Tectomicrobia bacterium]|nr:glycosyltransferase family 39 protein [Candidatus Tectomicrobia bacterium]